MIRRTRCYFSGQVQGVGFRYTARELASDFDVTGFVRNLSDGRVELVMEGEDRERKGLLDAVNARMEGFVDHVDVFEEASTGEFTRFSIAL